MNRLAVALTITLAVGACSKNAPQPRAETPQRPQVPAAAREAPPRPRPTIDPKSNEAAEELVRGFVGLINDGRFDEAYMLLGPNAPPRPGFDQRFKDYSRLRATLGAAGGQEGAAGSIYVTVPLTISGENNGKHVERSADAVLRRVNDVPGSTEAERRWHIERIDWKWIRERWPRRLPGWRRHYCRPATGSRRRNKRTR